MEQVQGQLQVEDGAVAPGRQVAAELAEEQRVGGGACRRGDVGGDLAAAAHPVVDVVAQVGSQVAAVRQDVQRDAGEGKQRSDFLRNRHKQPQGSQRNVFDALPKEKRKQKKTAAITQTPSPLTHAEVRGRVQ